MSHSVRPQRRQPTRLPRPWDSPGKNTGVGCHFLLQCMKVKSESEVAQLRPTPATPWTSAYQAPPSMGFFQARVLEWGAIAFSRLLTRYILFQFVITNKTDNNRIAIETFFVIHLIIITVRIIPRFQMTLICF